MNHPDSHAVTSLLPAARVHVFSNDEKTRKAALSGNDDWRFSRVEIEVIDGDIDSAIAVYDSDDVADVIVVQTDTIDDTLLQRLGTLAEYCHEDTAAIVIGPKNDVDLYRALIDMGVSDYLVAPVKPKDFVETLARSVSDKLGASNSKLITFIGAKGGVGTSALSQAASWASADILGQKTLLIDAASGWSSHGIGMGFEPATTLAQAVRAAESDDQDNLDRMIISISDNLDVLGTGGDVMLDPPIDSDQMERLTDTLMMKYPAVIADLSGATPQVKKTLLMKSSKIAVIATPMLASLRQARTLIQEITSIRDEAEAEVSLIINMLGLDKANEINVKDIKAAMEHEPSALIDFAAKIFMKGENESAKITSTTEGRAIVEDTIVPLLMDALGASAPAAAQGKGEVKKGLLAGLGILSKKK